jgi:hypothetical protein
MNIMKSFNETNTIKVGKIIFTQTEKVEWNNHKYSKGWHRAHGGVKEVSDRQVVIERIDGRAKGGLKLLATVQFDGWRGNVLLQAIKNSGIFTAPASKAPLSVRLDKFYDATAIRQIGHVKIWRRTLLGETVDFCAVLNGVTFHAKNQREAVRGVHYKIKAVAQKRNEPISYKLCKDLGFCDTGIKQFCEVFNLDLHGTYSPVQIEELVANDTAKAAPFEQELRKVAEVLNYKASI